MSDVTPWYVVRTKPIREQQAASALSLRGVRTYLPTLRKRKPRAGRRDWEPLFPGYLFASLHIPSDDWLAARSAPDVAYFLGAEGRPIALPDGFVDSLMGRVAVTNGDVRRDRFAAGDRVTIIEGPFQFMEALFDRKLSPDGRSRVFVQLLHRLIPVQLSEEYLKKTG